MVEELGAGHAEGTKGGGAGHGEVGGLTDLEASQVVAVSRSQMVNRELLDCAWVVGKGGAGRESCCGGRDRGAGALLRWV